MDRLASISKERVSEGEIEEDLEESEDEDDIEDDDDFEVEEELYPTKLQTKTVADATSIGSTTSQGC